MGLYYYSTAFKADMMLQQPLSLNILLICELEVALLWFFLEKTQLVRAIFTGNASENNLTSESVNW